MVDRNALRTNQMLIVLFVVLGFVFDSGWLLLFVAIALASGVLWPGRGLFQQFYQRVIVRSGLVQPQPVREANAPHRFAQAMGATVLTVATVLLFAGFDTFGWILAGLVATLALINLIFGFCAGCFIYLQLGRLRAASA